MTRLVVLLGTLAALTLGRDLAAQQQRQARDGFWFGAALGSGWARVSCQICQGNNRSGLSGTLRLGGGVSRKVLIGAEVAAWWATIETGTDTVHQSLAESGAAAPDRTVTSSGSQQRRSTPIPVYRVDKPAWGVVQSVKDDVGDAVCAQS